MPDIRKLKPALFLVFWLGAVGCGVKGDPSPYITQAMLNAEEKAAATPAPAPVAPVPMKKDVKKK